jgi:hypothetical protein
MTKAISLGALTLLLSFAVHRGLAQSAGGTAVAVTSTANAQPDFHPSMGDLMTMAVQPRHIKLGLAGQLKNWNYARYELSELRNAFGRIARTIPVYQKADTAALFTAMTQAPLAALSQAIESANAAQFRTAYAQLTAACNACHISQNHGAVVIRVPAAAMFPDQDFRPVNR